MIKNYDQSVEINHNPNWPYIPDHPYRILIVSDSGLGKNNVLLNLIKHQRPDIGKICLYVKDPFESKYQLFINGREEVGTENLKNPKAFIDYSQTNVNDYNVINKRRALIAFNDMIADIESDKKLDPKVTELFFKKKKTQYFTCFYITVLFQSA